MLAVHWLDLLLVDLLYTLLSPLYFSLQLADHIIIIQWGIFIITPLKLIGTLGQSEGFYLTKRRSFLNV